jgi:hypothetical protein
MVCDTRPSKNSEAARDRWGYRRRSVHKRKSLAAMQGKIMQPLMIIRLTSSYSLEAFFCPRVVISSKKGTSRAKISSSLSKLHCFAM